MLMRIKNIRITRVLLWVLMLAISGCSMPDTQPLGPAKNSVQENPASSNTQSGVSVESKQAQFTPTPKTDMISNPALGSIGNLVWEDLNSNGLQEDNEPGVAEVLVNLLSDDGKVIQTTLTDQAGEFFFGNLSAGEYALEFNYPATLFSPQHAGSDQAKDSNADAQGRTGMFYLEAGEQRSDLDAGLVYPGHAAVCPLTGLPTDASLLENRPIFISISHFPAWATRPATGLNSAPVVFETLIDEGQTRMQALFYCGYPAQAVDGQQTSKFDIRGVRSGRVFYSELAQLFGAGLIFGGASAEVYKEIAAFQCGVVDNTETPQNIGDAGLNIESLQAIAAKCKHSRGNTELDIWHFGPPSADGQPAGKFLMHYNHLNQTRWEYDPSAGGYLRYQNDPEAPNDFSLSTDKLTGDAIVRQNVLLLEVPHEVLNRSGTIISFDLTDERGYAWLLRDGIISKVCWSAVFDDYATPSNRYRPFLLYDCNSKESVNFATGSTWINVVDPSFWLEQNGEYLTAKQPFLGYGP